MIRWLIEQINLWVILGALAVAGLMVLIFGGAIFLSPAPTPDPAPVAQMTVIAAPTITMTPSVPTATVTPTPPEVVGGLWVGSYVQIAGTDGAGLRLRSGPGTTNPHRFIAMDSELFMVKDGPRESDGFTWWFLEAPYDPERSGWAAATYLQMIEATPVPTP